MFEPLIGVSGMPQRECWLLPSAAHRLPRWIPVALLLALAPIRLDGAVPKTGGGGVVTDDLATGVAGGAELTGAGGNTAAGSIGQSGIIETTGGPGAAEAGYFSKAVSSPAGVAFSAVHRSSASISWSEPAAANPAGTVYEVEVSTLPDYSTFVSSRSAAAPITLFGLAPGSTYYARVRASYLEGDDSPWAAAPAAQTTLPLGTSTLPPLTKGWQTFTYDLGSSFYYPFASTAPLGALGLKWQASASAALTGDVNGDGFLELVATDGSSLKVYDRNGNVLSNTPTTATLSILADVTGDGFPEIFLDYRDASNNLKIDIRGGAGTLIKTINRGSSGYDSHWGVRAVIGDKIFTGEYTGYSLVPRGAGAYSYASGNQLWYYEIGPCISGGHRTGGSGIGDVNNDGKLEQALGTFTCHNGKSANGTTDGDIYSIAIDEDGQNVWTKKISTDWNSSCATDGWIDQAVVDLDGDGTPEVIGFEYHDPTYYPGYDHIHLVSSSGANLRTLVGPLNGGAWTWAIADINNDGKKEIVASADNERKIYVLDNQLNLLASASGAGYARAVADMDGDGNKDIITYQPSTSKVRVLKADLSELYSYPINDVNPFYGMVSDLDADGKNEIIAFNTTSNRVYVLGAATITANAFSGVFATSATTNWSSTFAPGTSYYATVSTDSNFSGVVLSSNTVNLFAIFAGLGANTAYYARVSTAAGGPFTSLGSTYTLAAVPGAGAIGSVYASSVSLQWASNGNPGGTEYRVLASTAADFTGTLLFSPWAVMSSTVMAGLSENTTYFFRVQARNGNLIETAYAALGSAATAIGWTFEVADTLIGAVDLARIVDPIYRDGSKAIWRVAAGTVTSALNHPIFQDTLPANLTFYAQLEGDRLTVMAAGPAQSALRGLMAAYWDDEPYVVKSPLTGATGYPQNGTWRTTRSGEHATRPYDKSRTLLYRIAKDTLAQLTGWGAASPGSRLAGDYTYRSAQPKKVFVANYNVNAGEYDPPSGFHRWPWGSGVSQCKYFTSYYMCEYADGEALKTLSFTYANPAAYNLVALIHNDNSEWTRLSVDSQLWLSQTNSGDRSGSRSGTGQFPSQLQWRALKTWSTVGEMVWYAVMADSASYTAESYGVGLSTAADSLDVFEVFDFAAGPVSGGVTGVIAGRVTASDGTAPLAGALVEAFRGADLAGTAAAGADGGYFIRLATGTYDVRASSAGRGTATLPGRVVAAGQRTETAFALAGVLAPRAFLGVGASSITASWASTFAPGTVYYAVLSTGAFPNDFAGNVSSATRNLHAAFTGLAAARTYHVQVATSPAGPFATLGSVLTSEGLVAHWRLDEGAGALAYDSSPGGRAGAVLGNPAWSPAGVAGGALGFDGADDYVRVTKDPALWGAAVTVEAWVRFQDYDASRSILEAWNVAQGYGVNMFYYRPDDRFYFQLKLAGVQHEVSVSASGYAAGVWRHFAHTYDGASQRAYIDGREVGANSAGGAFAAPDSDLYIGFEPTYLQRYFKGRLDEVKVYAGALSPERIAQAASAVFPQPSPEIGTATLSVAWGASFSAGTTYYVTLSSSALPNADSGNLSAQTQDRFSSFAGLSANTTYYARVSTAAGGSFSLVEPVATLANAVSGAQAAAVFKTSVTVAWQPLPASPPSAGCRGYLVQASTTAGFTGAVLAAAVASVSSGSLTLEGLSESATYYLRVGSLNWGGVPNFALAGSTRTLAPAAPVAPSGFAGLAVGTGTILWSWSDNSADEEGFRVMSAAASLSGDLPADTASWLQAGLSVNTAYGPYAMQAFRKGAASSSGSAARYTLGAVPVGPGATVLSSTSVRVAWQPGGNPLGTVFQVQRSTEPSFSAAMQVFSGAATSYLDLGLLPGLGYAYRVRALNGDAVATAYSSTAGATTLLPGPPAAPSGFAGTAVSSAAILWSWGDVAGEEGYRVMSGTTNLSGSLAAGTTTWLQGSLSPNTRYGPLYAQAFNTGGVGNCAGVSRHSLAAPPGEPVALAISSTSASLAWASGGNPAGTDYSLERSSGAGFAELFNGTVLAFADGGLSPGATYFYRVRAFNAGSAASAYAGLLALRTSDVTAPSAPTGLAGAAAGTSRIVWSWVDNAGDESGYRVLSGTSNVSGDLPAGTAGWTQAGLSTNTLHGPYHAQAFNAGGAANSGAAARYTLAAPPASFTATSVSSASLSLSWAANGNPAGTLYELQPSGGCPPGKVCSAVVAPPILVSTTAYSRSGLTASTTFLYLLKALNGDGAPTTELGPLSVVTLPPDPPSAPSEFAGSALGPAAILWTWTDNSANESGFRVLSGASALSGSLPARTTYWLQAGLSPNTLYGPFVARAFNAGGASDSAGASRYTLAAAPQGLSVAAVSSSSVSLGWSAGGNPAGTVFQLQRSSGGAFATVQAGTATAFTDAGLAGLTLYRYQVRAVNGDGSPSAFSVSSAAQTQAPGPPTAPSAFAGTALSTDSIRWSWTDAAGEAGYRVMLGAINLSGTLAADSVRWVQTGLSANTPYGSLHAQAFNAGGVANSGTALRFTLAATPAHPLITAASAVSVSVAWTAGGNPSGTVYELERSTGAGFLLAYSGTSLARADGGRSPGTTHIYRLRALNGDGIASGYSETAQARTSDPGAPASAGAFAGEALDAARIVWSWVDAASDEAGYRVMSGAVNLSGDLPAATTRWVQAGLSTNTAHGPYHVQAFNAGGASNSGFTSRYTLAARPEVPVVPAVSSAAASLAWGPGGNPAQTMYEVQRSSGAGYATVRMGPENFLADDGLSPSTTYQYRVRAMNGDGMPSAFSDAPSVTTLPPEAPRAPAGFGAAAAGRGAIRWSWVDNARNEAGYRVRLGTVNVSGDLKLNTIAWLQTGLSTNALYGPFTLQAFNGGGVAASTAVSRYTSAAVPGLLSAAALGADSIALSWATGGNPVGTLYELQRASEAAFAAAASVYVGTAAAFTDSGLRYLTAYRYRVRALNGDALATAFALAASAETPAPAAPAGPAGFAGTALSSDAIRWSWVDSQGEEGYRVMSGAASLSGDLAAQTTYWDQPGLSPDAAVGPIFARAFNAGGARDSSAASRRTLAAPPGEPAATAISSTGVTLAWTSGGNPAATVYVLERSAGAGFSSVFNGVALGFADSGLSPATTYQYRLRAVNGEGAATAHAGPVSARTSDLSAPAAPTGFAGAALDAGRILWTWQDNAFNEAGYRVMSGAANISGDLPANGASWLQAGLSTNTLYGPYRVQAFNAGGAADSGSARARTKPRAPSSPAVTAVSSTAVRVSFDAGDNPASTVFELLRSTGGPYSAAARGLGGSLSDAGLSASTAYLYKVRAVNEDGVPSEESEALLIVTAPAAPARPAAPSAPARSTGSITWAWAEVPGATAYRVYEAGPPLVLLAAVEAPVFSMGDLPANSLRRLAVAAVNDSGEGPASEAASAHTLAREPAGSAVAALFESSATLRWDDGGNPPGTLAEVERSTDGATYARVLRGALREHVEHHLKPCTPYFFRVRHVAGDGTASGYDAEVAFVTAARASLPPSGLRAGSQAGNRIGLTWRPSPSDDIAAYRLYYDAGGAGVDYAVPLAVLVSTATSYTTDVLASSAAYRFGLRAVNRCGVQEDNAGVTAAAASLATLAGVRASIVEPQGGKRVAGTRILVKAEIVSGSEADARGVRFQYKPAAAAEWRDIEAANANHPNPDLSRPWFVHWNVSELPEETYELRAVARDFGGTEDAAPSAVSVIVDRARPEVVEESLGGGSVRKTQLVHNGSTATVQAADEGSAQVTQVNLPPLAVSESTASLTVINNPVDVPSASTAVISIGAAAEITLSNGQTLLEGGRTAEVEISYADADDDGIVDGTVVRARDLAMYSFDEAAQAWVKDIVSAVDTGGKKVKGATPHFSFFALFGAPPAPQHAALSGVRVYPNPYKPNGGDPDKGRAFSAGDPSSGIVFDNLPAAATITIYTITGKRVARFSSDATGGRVQWDARNEAGKDVASGGYVAVITSPGQTTETRVIGVVR